MSGTLFGLGLSQQFDVNGDPLSGALLYIYQANSSTPVIVYKNIALTAGQEHPWPITADSTGRIPAFWLADGSYRARLTNAGGVSQFDEANILAIGPSSGSGPADTTDPNSIATTGDVIWRPTQGDKPGWVRMHGGTIGSLASGSTYTGALATHEALFAHIWQNFSNTICPTLTSAGSPIARGADALTDWNADRRITILDMRGRSPFGFTDMGRTNTGSLASVTFSFGDAITNGGQGGIVALPNIARNQLPNVDFMTDGVGNIPIIVDTGSAGAPTPRRLMSPNTSLAGAAAGINIVNDAGAVPSIGGHIYLNSNVSQQPLAPTVPPMMVGTWFWRL